jgi:hypothetical protein
VISGDTGEGPLTVAARLLVILVLARTCAESKSVELESGSVGTGDKPE